MRTRALIAIAALGAAGVTTAMAQTVYSVNVVGFVNIDVLPGYNMVCNPLKGTNNNISTILPTVLDGTSIQLWNPQTQMYDITEVYYGGDLNVWDPGTANLDPGVGLLLSSPAPGQRLTFVGEVPEGDFNKHLYPGYNLAAHFTPQQINMTDAAFPAVDGDSIQRWNAYEQRFDRTYVYYGGDINAWDPEDPTINVGEGFFVSKATPGADWTRSFHVN